MLTQASAKLQNVSEQAVSIGYSGFYIFNYLMYPLGGLMGDIVFGRYKTIKGSLLLLLFTASMLAVSGVLIILKNEQPFYWGEEVATISMAVCGCIVLFSMIGLVPFFATVIPFAMDQLHDSPVHHLTTFVCWYVLTVFVSSSLSALIFSVVFYFAFVADDPRSDYISVTVSATVLISLAFLVIVVVIATYIISDRKIEWFNVQPCIENPYKLVYRVTRFAWQHRIPIRRSAFTYCEDDPPSRLDLGKSKYGGPFTTEEVEDVKVFYEIMKVVVCLGPFMYLFEEMSVYFDVHLLPDSFSRRFGRVNDSITYVLVSAILSLYLCFHRCRYCFKKRLPIFRKLEIGIIIMLIKLVFMLLVDISAHYINESLGCMFKKEHDLAFSISSVAAVLAVHKILSALAITILYTTYLEFICAQSPHSMKGMLIGLSYALLRGVAGILKFVAKIPFQNWTQNISCGFIYYSMNLTIGILGFFIFVWVAKVYKYRQRDEPSRVHQYAEDYYSKTQQESNYEYSPSPSPTPL